MFSGEHKRETFHDKLQLLRSITNSHAMTETSIVVDASNYIKDLKQKVELLNQEIATVQSSSNHNLWPQVSVETLEKGFLVNVDSRKCCPGLLVSILETFEQLGLDVIDARVSCADSFHLQAFGGENDEDEDNIDAQMVKLAISNTIKNWSESNE
ncbi:hypothetical protein BUALT_Bualt06G0067700 [Buddleja alternifolia]|uniref:Plant bHLH transcription factor ACT-like domain-containing protein n=1 Tax=Buddleja alternifolia TaxID=168488 RepID=A0AAV6XL57_9LAMI|nr:hypothetical protein BUALT_Bualt06G0067700 [Buddleja alternifolia]